MGLREVRAALAELGVEEPQFRVLGLMPLVETAWADGRIQFSERMMINRFAKHKGWYAAGGQSVISNWLSNKPDPLQFQMGRKALVELSRDERGLGAAFDQRTLDDTLVACADVARASKNMLGLKDAINESESRTLQDIADSFDLGPWREALDTIAKRSLRIPAGPPGHMLVGSLPEFKEDPLSTLVSAWREYGDVAQIHLGPLRFVIVAHPDGVKHVLVDNNRNYARPQAIEVLSEAIGQGLLVADGDHWKKQRRTMAPAFQQGELLHMADTMTGEACKTAERWPARADNDEPVDMAVEMARMTLAIAGKTLFGVDLSDEASDIGGSVTILLLHISERLRTLLRVPLAIPTAANRRFLKARDHMDSVIYGIIADRRSGTRPPHRDLLQMLLDARDPETGEGMSDEQLRDELITMLGAGHETTANALTWTWYFLSHNPPVQARLLKEIETQLGSRTPTPADLPAMPYTRMVLEESMRLRPPVWLVGRRAIAEDRVMGYPVHPGEHVFLSPYITQRHPGFWDNPEAFDPDRFAPDRIKTQHPYAAFPFSGGPRKCIGSHFAMMEMQLVLPILVRAAEFRLVAGFEPTLDPGVTLRPQEGMWMTMHGRG